MLEIIQLPVLNDNYIYLIHDPITAKTAVVDPAIAQPVLTALKSYNWTLDFIFNTHHHMDHVGANLELKQKTNCQILGCANDSLRIPGIDCELKPGDSLKLGTYTANVIATPGHTLGHIVYYFSSNDILFCGDTLFSMGCGRLFEGSATQMWHSLQHLKKLPPQTRIYCAHEYTQDNARFALTLEPKNLKLQQRIQAIDLLRAANKPTIPSTIELELATNPFFRENSLELQKSIGMIGLSAVEIFSKTRELKDNFC